MMKTGSSSRETDELKDQLKHLKPLRKTRSAWRYRYDFWVKAPCSLHGLPEATDRIAEAFFTIFSLYILIEFGNFQQNCSPGALVLCGGQYLAASDNMDTSDWLMSCDNILDQCEDNPFVFEETRLRRFVSNGLKNEKVRFDDGFGMRSMFVRPTGDDSSEVMFPWLDGSTENQIEEMSVLTSFFGIPIYHYNTTNDYTGDLSESGICEGHNYARDGTGTIRRRPVEENCVRWVNDANDDELKPWPCFRNRSVCYEQLPSTYNTSNTGFTFVPNNNIAGGEEVVNIDGEGVGEWDYGIWNYTNASTGNGNFVANNVLYLKNERGNDSELITQAVNKALSGEENAKRVMPQMNLCACINRVSADFEASEECEMVTKIYFLVIFGILNIFVLEATKGVDDLEDQPFVHVSCHEFCAHDGNPRISVLRVFAFFMQFGYYFYLWWIFVARSCDAPIFQNAVQITEALAICSLLCTTTIATLELGVAIFGHITWCCCGYQVERDVFKKDDEGNYKYETHLKMLEERALEAVQVNNKIQVVKPRAILTGAPGTAVINPVFNTGDDANLNAYLAGNRTATMGSDYLGIGGTSDNQTKDPQFGF
eukprot:m.286734 g.286734  ORF g.286734 m.286734 type:complete len:596 (-) comp27063_c0_seq2:166-1953(-)